MRLILFSTDLYDILKRLQERLKPSDQMREIEQTLALQRAGRRLVRTRDFKRHQLEVQRIQSSYETGIAGGARALGS